MPMGPYADFAACVLDQKKKGQDAASANRICGHIKAKTEGMNQADAAEIAKKLKFDEKGRLIIAENVPMEIKGAIHG